MRHLQLPAKHSALLQHEFNAAKVVHAQARQAVAQMMERLRHGRPPDVPQLKAAVDAMLDSVGRNRDAMGWLARSTNRDDYLNHHSFAAAVWALSFGHHLGLDKETLKVLGLGAMLLDVGKAGLPSKLLNKAGRPTAQEWSLIRAHVDFGVRYLRCIPEIDEPVINMVATHHERFDGTGYPRKLQGDEIPLIGGIAAIVDCYDAMTSERRYAKPVSTYDAIRELRRLSGSRFHPELVELFIQAIGVFPAGTLVELNTGDVGVVVGQNHLHRLRPEVILILDAHKNMRKDFVITDLNEQNDTGDDRPAMWIMRGLEHGAFGVDPTEYFL